MQEAPAAPREVTAHADSPRFGDPTEGA